MVYGFCPKFAVEKRRATFRELVPFTSTSEKLENARAALVPILVVADRDVVAVTLS